MIPAWQRFLDDLERDAASRPLLKELRRAAPSGSVVVGLLIDAAGEGRQTHSYSLRGEQGILEEPAAFALGGLIAQRLPAHRILRAGFCDAGVFHYWALVDPSGRAGSTVEDEPSLLRLRAQAFAELLRTVARMGAEPAPNPDPQLPAALDLKTEPASKYPAWYFRQNG
jgi:hypothetical protein